MRGQCRLRASGSMLGDAARCTPYFRTRYVHSVFRTRYFHSVLRTWCSILRHRPLLAVLTPAQKQKLREDLTGGDGSCSVSVVGCPLSVAMLRPREVAVQSGSLGFSRWFRKNRLKAGLHRPHCQLPLSASFTPRRQRKTASTRRYSAVGRRRFRRTVAELSVQAIADPSSFKTVIFLSLGQRSRTWRCGLGILLAFCFQVPSPVFIVFADHFHHQVRALRLMMGIGNTPGLRSRRCWDPAGNRRGRRRIGKRRKKPPPNPTPAATAPCNNPNRDRTIR